MRRRGTRFIAVAGLAIAAMVVPGGAVASALAVSDTIQSVDEFSYTGGTGVATPTLADPNAHAFILIAGQQSQLTNVDLPPLGSEHNVVADDDGLDGQPLFSNSLIAPGTTAPVNGTQYLQPGDYQFSCTIHYDMHGTLQVEGSGAVARPHIAVAVASPKLKKLKGGELKVSVTATTLSDDVSVSARVGGKPAGSASDVDLIAGQKQTLTLKLSKDAKKAVKTGLKKGKKVAVSVSASVPWGAPASAKKNLK
jgi:hypothetical protein